MGGSEDIPGGSHGSKAYKFSRSHPRLTWAETQSLPWREEGLGSGVSMAVFRGWSLFLNGGPWMLRSLIPS
jgi:hypothetical protein